MSEHSTRLRELSCSSYARKVCDEAADEIERLLEECATKEGAINLMGTRIEELEKQNGLLLGEIARRSEVHAKRIEELEKALRIAKVTLDAWDTDAITITTDQIRAAWMMANSLPGEWKSMATEMLRKAFNIVRCECADHGLTHGESGPCALCDGEGWVVKE